MNQINSYKISMCAEDYFEQNSWAVINALITAQQLTKIEKQLKQIHLTTADGCELLTMPWCQLLIND